jgi:antitoxin MazE
MAHLVSIGQAQGIEIPQVLIKQAHLEDADLELKIVKEGLLITPQKKTRAGWKQQVEMQLATHGEETIDEEWLDANLNKKDETIEW